MNFKLEWIKAALDNFESEIKMQSKLSDLFMYKFLVENGFQNIKSDIPIESRDEIENRIFTLVKRMEELTTKENLEETLSYYNSAVAEYERLLDVLKNDKSTANMREVCYARDFVEALRIGLNQNNVEVDSTKLNGLDSKVSELAVPAGDIPPWGIALLWWNRK